MEHRIITGRGEMVIHCIRLKRGEDLMDSIKNLCANKGIKAGEYFQRNLCDIIFQHIGTYVTSDAVLPVHQMCKAPTTILR
jgi:hypothetical protein